jgi:hypothetical protein
MLIKENNLSFAKWFKDNSASKNPTDKAVGDPTVVTNKKTNQPIDLHLMAQCNAIDDARRSATNVFQSISQNNPFKVGTDREAFRKEILTAVNGLGRAHILLYYLARGSK